MWWTHTINGRAGKSQSDLPARPFIVSAKIPSTPQPESDFNITRQLINGKIMVMEKFPNPYNFISSSNIESGKVNGELSKERHDDTKVSTEENEYSYFGQELQQVANLLESKDKEILQKINRLVTEDMYELSNEEVAREYTERHYEQLSDMGKLFLLEQSINYLADDEFNDDWTDMLLISREVLNLAKEENENFFVSNFAKSFIEENDFLDNLENNPREYIERIWSRCVIEKENGDTTFRGDYVDVDFSRQVNSVDELTDSEVEEIVRVISLDSKIFGHEKTSNSYEWVEREENKEFSNNYISPSILSDEDLSVCNLASDVNGVYDGMSGRLVEYLPNKSVHNIDGGEFSMEVFMQEYRHTMYLFDDIAGVLEYKGEIKSDIPENIKAILPDVLNSKINIFLNRYKGIRENGTYATDEYGRVLLQDESELRMVEQEAQYLKESIKEVLDNFLVANARVVNPVDIREVIGNNESEIEYLHKLFASKRMRQHMERYFGFKYEELTLATQISFIKFVLDKDNNGVEKVRNFISQTNTGQEKVNRFRTFLSLEQGDESLGNDIVEFGQNFVGADKIFSYYGELLNSADNAEELVKEAVDCDSVECSAFIEQVRENILNRAQKDLEKAVRAKDLENLEQSLGNYVTEAKEYVALLQEVGKSNIEKVSANSLSEADKKSMAELLIKNYEVISPGEDQAGFREAVFSSLINSFDNPNTEFRILRDKDKIVSFNRFDTVVDERGNEITYFGSFNADPAYSGVGGVVLEETIKERLKDGRPMQAHTDPDQPITKKYINSGFVVTKIENNYAGTGRMIFEIWQSSDVNNILKTKQVGDDELLSMIGSEDGEVTVREQRVNDKYEEIDNGMVLTRYIKDKNKTYLVFEKYTFGAKEDGVDNENKLKEKEAA